jgi:peptidoglycan/LPS O-acetylase OafA/YrhL
VTSLAAPARNAGGRTSSGGGRAGSFRPEIHALRAAAVSLVILFHLWPKRLPGGYIGVDVFFVISGFLITSHLLREVVSTGTVKLSAFWARRVRRLLPAALLVLAATVVGSLAFLPKPSWQDTFVQIAAAAGYVVNWVLAASSVDYFAADNPASPVQHYWSLSVEEQFYLVWPVLILLLVLLARLAARHKRNSTAPLHGYLGWGIAAVGAVSFAYSVWYSATSGAAYFSTFTHAWEFAAGALLSFAVPAMERSTRKLAGLRAAGLWLGFGTLGVCGFVFTGALAFPGWVAIVPVAGALLVIAAGDTSRVRFSLDPVARWRPVQWLGDVSYSAYLWHWPLIVLAPHALGRVLTYTDKLVLLAATLALAHATKTWVEDPVRFSRALKARTGLTFAAAAACMALVVAASGMAWQHVENETAAAQAAAARAAKAYDQCYGASAVLSGADCPDPYRADPKLLLAAATPVPQPTPVVLSTGMEASEYHASTSGPTIALVGDSHARMYLPGLYKLAVKHGWRLLEIRHNDCTPSAPTWSSTFHTDMSTTCQQFRHDLIDRLAPAKDVDVVVTSSVAPRYANMPGGDHDQIASAFETTYRAWMDNHKSVVVIADVPGPSKALGQVPACVAAATDLNDACSEPRGTVLETDLQAVAARRLVPNGLTLVDFSNRYCDPKMCHATIGGLVMYANGGHISGPFSVSLAPFLEGPILKATKS